MATFTASAKRLLSELALGGPSSDVTSEDTLTTLLSVRSALLIVKEILEDEQTLSVVAKASYRHSNGFDKITLVSAMPGIQIETARMVAEA